jgi:hypothetical protein
MDQAFIPAITALVVAVAGLLTTVVTLINVLKHGAAIEATRQAVNGQSAQLDASIKVMESENTKRAGTPT